MRNRSSMLPPTILVVFVLALLIPFAPLSPNAGAQTDAPSRVLVHPEVRTLPSKEKRWALIVGIDEYKKDVSSLKGAVNDARALKDVLVKYAGFPVSQIALLTTDSADPDQLPTRANILDELDSLTHKIPADGLLLFSFSGHGVSIDNDAYLVPSDGRITKNPRLLRDFSIDVQRIKEAIKEIKVDQVVMLLDACRNQPGRGEVANELAEAYNRGFSFDVANSEVKAFATLYATSIGSRAFEFYDKDTRRYRGYFSYAIEEGVKGKAANANGEITLSGLITYIENTVPRRVKFDKGEIQVPSKEIAGYKDSELVLAIGVKRAVDLAVPTNTAKSWPKSFRNQNGIDMVYIPSGSFMMGTTRIKQAMPVHKVTFNHSFYMGKFEVTQAQWRSVMENNPAKFQGEDLPIETVSWDDAVVFIARLNEQNDGYSYRLPSEAEWEYACRAGTTTPFATGDFLRSDQANFDGDLPYEVIGRGVSREKTTPVGSFQPNAFGLYDMHGNVAEWCEDWYHPSYEGAPSDGSAWLSDPDLRRVLRGGAWDHFSLSSAFRLQAVPDFRSSSNGFRVVAIARHQ